ncbi:hypothetical protein [Burkholderia cepacia]
MERSLRAAIARTWRRGERDVQSSTRSNSTLSETSSHLDGYARNSSSL